MPRDQLYVVTKLANPDQGYDSTLRAFDASMERLGLDYLDLYLIHWPQPRSTSSWTPSRLSPRLRDQGRIRSIGVSNFEPEHLMVLIDATGIVPAVNQIELHPQLPQAELREVHAQPGHRDRGMVAAGPGIAADPPDDHRRRAKNVAGHPPRC